MLLWCLFNSWLVDVNRLFWFTPCILYFPKLGYSQVISLPFYPLIIAILTQYSSAFPIHHCKLCSRFWTLPCESPANPSLASFALLEFP